MNISPLQPSVKSSFQRLNSDITIELRSGGERRIHADRRKEKRVGDVTDRRQLTDRRTK